jgi:hypothetical protein
LPRRARARLTVLAGFLTRGRQTRTPANERTE